MSAGTSGMGSGAQQGYAAALGLARAEDAHPQRVAELAGMLMEVAGNLDQLAWGTWKAVNPASGLKRRQNLRQLVARYAAGDAGVTREQVKEELDRLRQLSAALIASLNQAGRQFAQKHSEAASPGRIEAAVRMGSKSVMTGHEAQCWRKYVEVAGAIDAETVERDLLGAMAQHAEALLSASAGGGGGGGRGA